MNLARIIKALDGDIEACQELTSAEMNYISTITAPSSTSWMIEHWNLGENLQAFLVANRAETDRLAKEAVGNTI